MVGRERPVASATAVMPPHPMAIASQAAHRRRTFSSITGRSAWYLFRTAAMISACDIKDRAAPWPTGGDSPCSGRIASLASGCHAFPCKARSALGEENTTAIQIWKCYFATAPNNAVCLPHLVGDHAMPKSSDALDQDVLWERLMVEVQESN